MESKTSRYQSRILREMHQNTENPFNSPPSSTGSHGTVTLTSDISYDPQRMGDESLHFLSKNTNKANRQSAYQINSAALDQDFIDYKDWKPASREQTTDIYNVTGEMDRRETKENHPPSSSTAASPTDQKLHDQNQKQFNVGAVSQKARSQMQARVDNESDGDSTQMSGSSRLNGQKPRRANVTSLIQSLKAAQAAKEAKSTPQKRRRRGRHQHNMRHPGKYIPASSASNWSRGNNMHMSPDANQTARSFFLPNLTHIDDFISGALKIQSVDNGMPVFVKHGRVHDRELKSSPKHHAEIEMIGLPDDEQQIFVSLDKIRDEIQALQAHDDQVSRQAEQFQEEVYELQLQLSKIRGRKDSAMGSDSDNSLIIHMNSRQSELEDKVATLQAKLDKANRKISINEIHTETYISERDEALKSATSQLERVHRLELELEAARKGLNGSNGNQRAHDAHGTEAEHLSLRDDNSLLREQYKSLLEENQSLRSHNTIVTQQNQDLQQEAKRLQRLVDVLQSDNQVLQSEYKIIVEEKQTLRQDNLSLERQNDKFFHDTKSLQQKNSLLERRVGDLQDNNAKLHQMVESANAETGTMTFDVKDLRDRLEKKNRELADENAQLQQQVVNLQSDYASKRLQFEQEKRRLDEEQDYLHDQVNRISKRFERVVQDSEEKDAEYEERQASLTQQLQDIANREAALAARLRESAGQESTLQREVQRRTEAIVEAQRIAREVQSLKTSTKPVKITRIVEPTTSRIRSTTSDMSLRNTLSQDLQMEDDYTQQLDLTHGSDFGDAFAKADMNRLQNALRQNQSSQQQRRDNFTEEYLDDVDAGFTEDMSQSLPPAFMPERNASPSTKTKAANAKGQAAQSKRQPSGILKNTQHTRRVSEQDTTGRFSIRSGMSGLSLPDHTTESNMGPHGRRHSDSERFEMDVEENMTSALFMDDITLDARKRRAEKEAATRDLTKESMKRSMPGLSKEAKRVLDGLCHDHDCSNCIVCTRIKSHAQGSTRKTTVRVEQPVPVTDRIANPEPVEGTAFEDQPTMRPSRDPAIALAVVIKNIKDELTHIKSKLMAKQTELNELDPSFGRRHRQQLNAEISQLSRLSEMKCEQLYQLYDVVEGQKMSGQQMSQEELEITIMSIQAKDDTWNGITD
ncbi:Spindle pole body protein ppc89 [Apiospora arundinis]